MDLSEVEGFDWLGMEAIVGYQRDLSSIHFYFEFEQVPEGENLTLFDEAGLIVLDTAGVVVSQETLARMAGNAIPITASLEQGVGVVRAQRLIMETIEWRVRDRLGRTWPLKSIIADMTYTTTKIFNAIEAHTYSGGGKNYSFASAEVQFGEAEGRLLLLRNEDESTSVYFVPVSGSGWEVSKAEEIGG